ncbi:hypothetical protein F5B20DRAFT_587503 [Whalleya microplaca]|nr:hypothetical protein F5B20DRAFT_587503 [Whalleya microplaca]
MPAPSSPPSTTPLGNNNTTNNNTTNTNTTNNNNTNNNTTNNNTTNNNTTNNNTTNTNTTNTNDNGGGGGGGGGGNDNGGEDDDDGIDYEVPPDTTAQAMSWHRYLSSTRLHLHERPVPKGMIPASLIQASWPLIRRKPGHLPRRYQVGSTRLRVTFQEEKRDIVLCLEMFGLNVSSIRSDHDMSVRNEIVHDFNNPHTLSVALVSEITHNKSVHLLGHGADPKYLQRRRSWVTLCPLSASVDSQLNTMDCCVT